MMLKIKRLLYKVVDFFKYLTSLLNNFLKQYFECLLIGVQIFLGYILANALMDGFTEYNALQVTIKEMMPFVITVEFGLVALYFTVIKRNSIMINSAIFNFLLLIFTIIMTMGIAFGTVYDSYAVVKKFDNSITFWMKYLLILIFTSVISTFTTCSLYVRGLKNR